MNRRTLFRVGMTLLACPWIASTRVMAAPPPPMPDLGNVDNENQRPLLSATGRKRLEENLKVLSANLRDLKANLATTEKNLETVQTELNELSNLEREHLDLKKRYSAYLAKAAQEMTRNERTRRDLAKWEASNRNVPKDSAEGAVRDKLETARLEIADRERWAVDAEAKTARVKQLMVGLDKNLSDLRSRRKPLEDQLAVWSKRKEETMAQIAEAEGRQTQWTKVLGPK